MVPTLGWLYAGRPRWACDRRLVRLFWIRYVAEMLVSREPANWPGALKQGNNVCYCDETPPAGQVGGGKQMDNLVRTGQHVWGDAEFKQQRWTFQV